VTYWGDGQRVRLQTIVLAERPNRFRIEVLSPFQEPLDVVASDGARLWWLSRDALRVGPATSERLAEVLPLPLAPETVVDLLMGGAPTSEAWVPGEVVADDGRWRLSLLEPGGRSAELWVDPDAPRIERIRLPRRGGQPAIDVELSDHEGPCPRRVQIAVPERELEVQIRLQSPEYDVDLDRSLFRIDPAPGRPPEPW